MAWETVWERFSADAYYYVWRTFDLKEAQDALYQACGGTDGEAYHEFAASYFGDNRPKYFYRTSRSCVFANELEAMAVEKEYMDGDETVATVVSPKPTKAKAAAKDGR
jgi:hypothetical protein